MRSSSGCAGGSGTVAESITIVLAVATRKYAAGAIASSPLHIQGTRNEFRI